MIDEFDEIQKSIRKADKPELNGTLMYCTFRLERNVPEILEHPDFKLGIDGFDMYMEKFLDLKDEVDEVHRLLMAVENRLKELK